MGVKKRNTKLSSQQIKFCEELASGKSQGEAYLLAYPKCKSIEIAKAAASRLLTNVNLFEYYQSLLKQNAANSEITRERVLSEYAKIAFSSIAHLHNTWIELKAFEKLTAEQKTAIQEISTQKRKSYTDDGVLIETEFVKIKLYDKLKALDSVKSMLGFDAPIKTESTQSIIWEEIKTYAPEHKTDSST